VARAFQSEHFHVEQARQYLDVASEQLRELDVLATHTTVARRYPGTGWKELRLVIECKRSDTPWILFIGDERFYNSGPHFASLDIIEYAGAKLAEARAANEMPVISYVGPLTYRLSNAGSKDKVTFDAVRQVESAVMGIRRDMVAPEQVPEAHPEVAVLVPVIVTDAPLVECRLDTSGEIELAEVDRGLLLNRLRPEERLHSVWIVNQHAVTDFAIAARKTGENMRLQTPG
jgi:hypothetical protein